MKLVYNGDYLKPIHYTDIELEEPKEKEIKDLKVRWLISNKDGAKNFAMRLFEIQPGGYSPLHQHDWEHEVFDLEGNLRRKIKKEVTGADLTLELTRTPDILAEVKGNFLKIGFAAETEDHVENARQKLANKQLDLVAANDVTAPDSGFAVDTNRVTLIDKNGKTEELPLMSKREVADKILDRVVGLLKGAG